MIKFKFISSILFILLFFFTSDIVAQIIQVVKPGNASASAKEIRSMIKRWSDVTPEEIESFYLKHWGIGKNYSNLCKHPEASVTSVDFPDVSFVLRQTPFSSPENHIIVSYLHLSDGAFETMIDIEGYDITLEVPNDVYLFCFQTVCGNVASALDIVIIEKPIFHIHDDRSIYGCQGYDLIWSGSPMLEHSGEVNYLWDNNNAAERYFAFVQFADGPSASFTANIQFEETGPSTVSSDAAMMDNVSFNEDETLIYAHEPGDPEEMLGVFSFFYNEEEEDAPQFSFNLMSGAPYNLDRVDLYRCENDRHREFEKDRVFEMKKGIGLKRLSNTFESYTRIEYSLEEEQEVSILLFDAYGQVIKVLKDHHLASTGSHQLNFDLAAFPSGVYFCVLKTQHEVLPIKLLKTR